MRRVPSASNLCHSVPFKFIEGPADRQGDSIVLDITEHRLAARVKAGACDLARREAILAEINHTTIGRNHSDKLAASAILTDVYRPTG